MKQPFIVGMIGCALLAAVRADAQTARGARTPTATRTNAERAEVSVDFGTEGASPSFASSFTLPVYLEDATINTSYAFKKAPQVNVGVVARVWWDLGVGVRLSYATQTDTAGVNAQVPHPFFFNQPRSLSADQPGLERKETGVHVQLSWAVHVTPRLDISVQGGPSFYFVTQALVTAVNYTDDYPYDSIAFVNSTIESQSKKGSGFNAGVDVAYMFQRRLGVGGSIRFSRAQVQFDLPTPAGSQRNAVRADVGGPQYGAGLRLRF